MEDATNKMKKLRICFPDPCRLIADPIPAREAAAPLLSSAIYCKRVSAPPPVNGTCCK